MTDIFCVGEMVIDFLPGKNAGEYVRHAGGAPANVAIAVSRLGFNSAIACKVGDDDFGHFLTDTLKTENVVVAGKPYTDKATTTMAFVTLKDGERSFTFARKPGADMFLTCDDIDGEQFKETVIVHAGSCSLSAGDAAEATVYALRKAHESGKLVSFDVNYRNLMWKDDAAACGRAVTEILPYVDLLKISDEEAYVIGGEDKLSQIAKENNIKVLVETLGAKGCRIFIDGEIIAEMPALKINKVDSTGAGDAFWGGFIGTLLDKGIKGAADITAEILTEAAKTGTINGAICCGKMGAIESLPTASEAAEYRKEFGL